MMNMYTALALTAVTFILWGATVWVALTDEEPYDATESSLSNGKAA